MNFHADDTRAARYRTRAGELAREAATTRDPLLADTMRLIAEGYRRLAEHREEGSK